MLSFSRLLCITFSFLSLISFTGWLKLAISPLLLTCTCLPVCVSFAHPTKPKESHPTEDLPTPADYITVWSAIKKKRKRKNCYIEKKKKTKQFSSLDGTLECLAAREQNATRPPHSPNHPGPSLHGILLLVDSILTLFFFFFFFPS